MKDPCGDETLVYLHFGSEYTNLHMIKLYRTEYTHKRMNLDKTGKICLRSMDCVNVNNGL